MQIKIDDLEAYIITHELKEGIKHLEYEATVIRFLNKPDEVLHAMGVIGKYKELIKRLAQKEED